MQYEHIHILMTQIFLHVKMKNELTSYMTWYEMTQKQRDHEVIWRELVLKSLVKSIEVQMSLC